MDAQELVDARERFQAATRALQEAQDAQADAIIAALNEGWTQRQIAALYGIKQPSVAQIIGRRRRREGAAQAA